MKVAFPIANEEGLLADHFGRAPLFSVYNQEESKMEIISNTGDHFGGKQPVPVILQQNNIKVLICKGLGRKAISMFDQMNIEVYITTEQIVSDALQAYKDGKLVKANEADGCSGRGHQH